MVAAFRPLTVLHPASGETVLALGTSRQLVFVGGPRPWLGRGSEYGKSISLGDGVKSKKDTLEVLLFLLLPWLFTFSLKFVRPNHNFLITFFVSCLGF